MPARASSRSAKMCATLVSEPPPSGALHSRGWLVRARLDVWPLALAPLFRSACSPSASWMLNSMGLIPRVEILAPMPGASDRLYPWFLRLPSVLAAAVGQTGPHRLGAPPRPRLDGQFPDRSSTFTPIASMPAPEPTPLRTRFTSRVSVVDIWLRAPAKDSCSQEGAHWQRQLDSQAAMLKTGYGLFLFVGVKNDL